MSVLHGLEPYNGSTVFVVDDHDVMRRMLGEYFRATGYAVLEFASGEEALDAYRRQSVHLMLLDVELPGCTGIDVLAEVRKHSSVPAMLMSAAATYRQPCFEAGANAFFHKPFNPSDIAHAAGSLLTSDRA